MVMVSALANCLKNIVNAERRGYKQLVVRPHSQLVVKFLRVMQTQGYIGDFTAIDDKRRGKIVINLLGRLNKCGVISPRFDISLDKIDATASQILPARQFGHVVMTTSKGVLTHEECVKKHTSGKILGYFF